MEQMATETFLIESTLSPCEAFGRVIDLSRVPEWDRGIRTSRLIDGTPAAVGARYEVAVTGFDGEPTSAIYELTAVDGNRAFTMVGTHADFRAEDTLTIAPSGSGCRLTYDAELVLLGDHPPISDTQLAATFPKVVAVAEAGLAVFLNP
jgi:hypothetical protein